MGSSRSSRQTNCITNMSTSSVTTVALVVVAVSLLLAAHGCEARHKAQTGHNVGFGRSLAAALQASNLTGTTYRPPIVNYKYQGGPIIWKPIHLYFVWYGTWTETQKNLLRTAAKSLTPSKPITQWPNLSNLWRIERDFYQELPGEARKYVSGSVTIAGEIDDHYSQGSNFNNGSNPSTILLTHVGNGKGQLPKDFDQGVYFLFASGDVVLGTGGSCSYHDYACPGGNDTACPNLTDNMVYSFIPLVSDKNGLLHGCNIFQQPGSNGMAGPPPNKAISPDGALDALVNSFVHQLFRAVVDPYFTAWYHNTTENSETAEMCAWTFAAGDWNYCGDKSVFAPDFPAGLPFRCMSFPNSHALVDPSSHSQFTQYGIDGSKFMIQKMWNLASKGCALQIEGACSKNTVVLTLPQGTIQRGLYFNGVWMQAYALGQNCKWKIYVPGAKSLTLTFDKVALAYDKLDYVTVAHDNVVIRTLTGFGANIGVKISGKEATISFVTDGTRSSNPDSAGFIMRYTAGY